MSVFQDYKSRVKAFYDLDPRYASHRKIALRVFLGLVALVLIFVIYAANELPLDQLANPKSDLATQIISSDDEILGSIYSHENRISIDFKDISPYVIDALIATEDERFEDHSGIDILFIPAILKSIVTFDPRGASTITMQLARNLYDEVGMKRNVFRKMKEIIVAMVLERKFTKEEIIVNYLNTVNIIGDAYGIEMASRKLFNKSAKDLKIEEATLIVGMLKGQGAYSPYKHPKRAKDRRNTVMDQMVKNNVLDPEKVKVDSLQALPVAVQAQSFDHVQGLAPYFREYVREYMKRWCKENGYNLYTDGLKIYTTIDSRMQRYAEQAMSEHMPELQKQFDKHIQGREPYKKDSTILTRLMTQSHRYLTARKAGKSKAAVRAEFNEKRRMTVFSWAREIDTTMSPMDSLKWYARFLESGFISIDPSNGHIKSWVGGINYKFFQYDHVDLGRRQVGSTFKPFVYAVALANGRTPCDEELNQPISFDNGWSPKNSDGSVGGFMTLRHGLATSTNLITARIMKEIGPGPVVDFARECGIKSPIDKVPAICLGTPDLSVLELTGAYSTFANRGLWMEPIFITRIEDRNGKVLEEFDQKQETRRVLSDDKAYEMVEMLKGVIDERGGTGGRLRYRYKLKGELAGKTGTTQNQSDGWFVGMVPNLVGGVWTGCGDRQMRFSSLAYGQGANMALPTWGLFLQKVYADKSIGLSESDRFLRPAGYGVCVEGSGRQYNDPSEYDADRQSRPTNADRPTGYE